MDIDITLNKDPGCKDINCIFVMYASSTKKRIGQDINISLLIERDSSAGKPILMSEEQLLQTAQEMSESLGDFDKCYQALREMGGDRNKAEKKMIQSALKK